MADTKDRRSEGKNLTPSSQRQRAERERLKALGLCTYCKTTPVKNRTVCYKCADRTKESLRRVQIRHALERDGIDLEDAIGCLFVAAANAATYKQTSRKLLAWFESLRRRDGRA